MIECETYISKYYLLLSCWNRGFKSPYYRTDRPDFKPSTDDLAACYCNAQPAGLHERHDVWLIMVKTECGQSKFLLDNL
jgi:hypothetical protein